MARNTHVQVALCLIIFGMFIESIFGMTLIEVPKNSTVFKDQEFVWPCRTDDPDVPHSTTWYHDDRVVKLRGPFHKVLSSGSLKFVDVQVDNQGVYRCQVNTTKDFATSSAAYLNVQYGARIVEAPSGGVVHEGDLVQVTCRVEGNPKPFILWEIDGYRNRSLDDKEIYNFVAKTTRRIKCTAGNRHIHGNTYVIRTATVRVIQKSPTTSPETYNDVTKTLHIKEITTPDDASDTPQQGIPGSNKALLEEMPHDFLKYGATPTIVAVLLVVIFTIWTARKRKLDRQSHHEAGVEEPQLPLHHNVTREKTISQSQRSALSSTDTTASEYQEIGDIPERIVAASDRYSPIIYYSTRFDSNISSEKLSTFGSQNLDDHTKCKSFSETGDDHHDNVVAHKSIPMHAGDSSSTSDHAGHNNIVNDLVYKNFRGTEHVDNMDDSNGHPLFDNPRGYPEGSSDV